MLKESKMEILRQAIHLRIFLSEIEPCTLRNVNKKKSLMIKMYSLIPLLLLKIFCHLIGRNIAQTILKQFIIKLSIFASECQLGIKLAFFTNKLVEMFQRISLPSSSQTYVCKHNITQNKTIFIVREMFSLIFLRLVRY